ncbi:MAG: MBL fold metallo-hydrolase [Bacteroidia bacterium]|nr:MBL fold metallo-hydrolase [Bacteroidia bacterium]
MSLYVASINSGSNGNCYYVGNGTDAVLVDVGISCREVIKRMQRAGLSIQSVKAIFISHEHSDHIRGLRVLSTKYNIPVYINEATIRGGSLYLDSVLIRPFEHAQNISVGELLVTPFRKEHDAADPYSFNISGNGITVGVYTDIGCACQNVVNYFKECHAVFLEANYDEEMLENGPYPFYLKKRISSNKGHLSNAQALELFKNHRSAFLSHVFLSHLSKENNSPQLVKQLFQEQAGDIKIAVASRDNESEVHCISADGLEGNCVVKQGNSENRDASKATTKPALHPKQTSLF